MITEFRRPITSIDVGSEAQCCPKCWEASFRNQRVRYGKMGQYRALKKHCRALLTFIAETIITCNYAWDWPVTWGIESGKLEL